MQKTKIMMAVGAALAMASGSGCAETVWVTSGTSATETVLGESIRLSEPSNELCFWYDSTEGTKMYTLTAAYGNNDESVKRELIIGDENTETVVLDAAAELNQEFVHSVAVYSNLQGAAVEIRANDSVTIVSNDWGILGQSNTENEDRPENSARISIEAPNISIVADNLAVVAFSNSEIELSASDSIYIEGTNAIDTRGNSLINVNADNRVQRVTIVGDVVFETPNAPGDAQNSGKIINSEVNINMTTAESSWTGRAYQSYRLQNGDGTYSDIENVELESDPYHGNVTGFTINMANGATWNVTGDSFVNTANVSDGGHIVALEGARTINAEVLNLDNGVVGMQGGVDQKMTVSTLAGTGGTINVATVRNEDGSLSTPNLRINAVDKTNTSPTLAMNYTGITADDLSDPVADITALGEQSLTLGEGQSVAQVRTVAEGDIRGAVTQTVDETGAVTGTTTAANTKLTDYSAINAMSLVQWRNEINHLTKRLGDIRNSEGTIGAWARVYGGESQWGSNDEIEMDHTTIQVGGDYRINDRWIVGGAFSYTDSDADLARGQADGDTYSLAAYATYTAEGGSYLDLIARYGYLKNDIDTGNMSLETGSSAFSLTAEMGHTFRFLEDRAYVEPQIEFTYGFVAGDDDTASNGVKIDQDDFQSFISRVGVRAGFDFPEKKGSFYGMLSYSYDFLGDADGKASKNGLTQALSEDLGGGWVTYGIGAQVMFGKSSYFYGDLERTSGGDIDNPYLFSAGVRITF